MAIVIFWTETSVPGKLLYLDCEEVAENQFRLSWGWPARDKKTGPLFETTHAVVQYRVGQHWTTLTDIQISPYMVNCMYIAWKCGVFKFNLGYHVALNILFSLKRRDSFKGTKNSQY